MFAQTYIPNKDGKYSHEGINAFLVKMRNDKGDLEQGVVIDDMGSKPGMNGVDNARIKLTNVKVAKKMFLDNITKLNQTSENSFEMVSAKEIRSKRERFLAATNRLLSGRICIACICLSESKMCLNIIQRFSKMRLSNGKKGISDTPISEYQLYQNQITPLIARTLVLNVGLNYIRNQYSNYITNKTDKDPKTFNQIVRLCCAIKPLLAWHANTVGNVSRERAGGQGYLSINRLESSIAVAHSAITAEGDSAVLMQKVSKEYVDDYSKNKLPDSVLPKFSTCKDVSSLKNILKDKTSVFDINTLTDLVKARELILLEELSKLNKQNSQNRESIYNYWMNQGSNLIQELAEIFGERVCLDQFINTFINEVKDEDKKLELTGMLVASTIIKKYLSFYLINDIISKSAANSFKDEYNNLIKEVFKFSDEIVAGFGVPEELIIAPIANDYKKYYQIDSSDGEFDFMKGKINEINSKIELRPKF